MFNPYDKLRRDVITVAYLLAALHAVEIAALVVILVHR
jgi:hypothetical protein